MIIVEIAEAVVLFAAGYGTHRKTQSRLENAAIHREAAINKQGKVHVRNAERVLSEARSALEMAKHARADVQQLHEVVQDMVREVRGHG